MNYETIIRNLIKDSQEDGDGAFVMTKLEDGTIVSTVGLDPKDYEYIKDIVVNIDIEEDDEDSEEALFKLYREK